MKKVRLGYIAAALAIVATLLTVETPFERFAAAGLTTLLLLVAWKLITITAKRDGAVTVLQHVQEQVMTDEESDRADHHHSAMSVLLLRDDDEAHLDLGRSSS